MKLNPNADSFYPSPYPNLIISMEPYYQGYVVSSPSLVALPPPPPPPPHYQQPYFYAGAGEVFQNLHPTTAVDSSKKQHDASKRLSKRRFLRDMMINDYGRRLEARHTKGSRPPRLARQPSGTAGCGPRIHETTLGNFTRIKKTKQPLAPVERERSTTIMIRNIPNRYTFVS